MKKIIRHSLIAAMLMALATSCSTFSDDSKSYDQLEARKDVSGTWVIKTASRNGVDITNDMDFTKFQLQLKADGTYHIENYLPFVVRTDGTWQTDDPTMPLEIVFKENDSAEPMSVQLNYPIIDGVRQLLITHSPGCYSNTYVYKMVKVSNE